MSQEATLHLLQSASGGASMATSREVQHLWSRRPNACSCPTNSPSVHGTATRRAFGGNMWRTLASGPAMILIRTGTCPEDRQLPGQSCFCVHHG